MHHTTLNPLAPTDPPRSSRRVAVAVALLTSLVAVPAGFAGSVAWQQPFEVRKIGLVTPRQAVVVPEGARSGTPARVVRVSEEATPEPEVAVSPMSVDKEPARASTTVERDKPAALAGGFLALLLVGYRSRH